MDINKADRESGLSALARAATEGHMHVASWLLDNGALVDVRDKNMRTPLHLAVSRGDLGLTELLCNRGASVNAADADGQTPLHEAVVCGHLNLTHELVVRDADVNARTQSGTTPLHLACWTGDSRLLSCLMRFGGDINATNNAGCTPLHEAAAGGHQTCCRLLVSKGANKDRPNVDGLTAADVAAINNFQATADLIRPPSRAPQDRSRPPRRGPSYHRFDDQMPAVAQARPLQQQRREEHADDWTHVWMHRSLRWAAYSLGGTLFAWANFLFPPEATTPTQDPRPQQAAETLREPRPEVAESVEPPSYILCPITQDVMEKPVFLSDGHTYEEAAIKVWLRSGKRVSPLTNGQLLHCNLTPNHAIKCAVAAWREKHPVDPEVEPPKPASRHVLPQWARDRFFRRFLRSQAS